MLGEAHRDGSRNRRTCGLRHQGPSFKHLWLTWQMCPTATPPPHLTDVPTTTPPPHLADELDDRGGLACPGRPVHQSHILCCQRPAHCRKLAGVKAPAQAGINMGAMSVGCQGASRWGPARGSRGGWVAPGPRDKHPGSSYVGWCPYLLRGFHAGGAGTKRGSRLPNKTSTRGAATPAWPHSPPRPCAQEQRAQHLVHYWRHMCTILSLAMPAAHASPAWLFSPPDLPALPTTNPAQPT